MIEQLDYNLLFLWFIGLNPDNPVCHPTTFTKERDRILNKELMAKFVVLLLAAPEVKGLLSSPTMAPSCGPSRPTVHWSRAIATTLNHLDKVVPKDKAAMTLARNMPKVTSAACCSLTKPIAPAPMARHGYFRKLLVLVPKWASFGTAIWGTATAL